MEKPTEEEMRKVLERAKQIADSIGDCGAYAIHEDAVIDTLRWVLGETHESPLRKY